MNESSQKVHLITPDSSCDVYPELDKPKPDHDPRARLRSWLGKVLRITITDSRVIVGCFACTDRDGNIILENSWEYASQNDDTDPPRALGLALVPGKHIVTMAHMT